MKHTTFESPPVAYAPVPFYWWTGERLERGRMAWQLDQLVAKGVRQMVISYPHGPDGKNYPGEPRLFTPEWWDLLRWFLRECRARGMTAGFQDYTLVHPILEGIGSRTPDMQGGQMSRVAANASGGELVRLAAEPGTLPLGAWAYPVADGVAAAADAIELPVDETGGLEWQAPAGDWLVVLVFARLKPFDPLHPESGRLAAAELYEPFARECPDEIGKTLNLFFQDELDFGARMPFWSNHLFDVFREAAGYDLRPWLPALWHDLGPRTAKVRLDFADTVTARVEACYFEPVFGWHEEHGTMFGHDNCGRGRMALGRSHYGDYFRAMRWYSAPGCDDPKLQGERAFKGLKVNSSIAQMYGRPRVWVEAFHSSGWGTAPAEVVAAINEDFAYGATVVNLHGLYYTSCGGWWEWAPPDFHFRQPYWQHSGALNAWLTRLSWLLSQGRHACDVAMVYPIAALDAEPADPSAAGVFAHVGNHALMGIESDEPRPEESAFQLGKFLFDRACDFDFIDHQSLERATVAAGVLAAGGTEFRVLLFPAMAAARFSTLRLARDFAIAGGMVIAYGCLPSASERAGSEDPELDALIEEIFGPDTDGDREKFHAGGGRAVFLQRGFDRVLAAIDGGIPRDVTTDAARLHVRHRKDGDNDVWFVFNPAQEAIEATLELRASGPIEQWDAWTGQRRGLPAEALPDERARVRVALAARTSTLIVAGPVVAASPAAASAPEPDFPAASRQAESIALDGAWEFTVLPTLDNRHGDFRLPSTDGCLGPEARRFRCAEEFADGAPGWESPAFDDSAWEETTWSFGPRFEVSAPIAPGAVADALEAALQAGADDVSADWSPYAFSLELGIERDPFLTHWLSGPHGLKGAVPDDFIDVTCDTPGHIRFLRAKVVVENEGVRTVRMGARCAYQLWLNGASVLEQSEALPPGLYAPWNIPHYECEPREAVVFLKHGENDLLLKLAQPDGQRARAYVAFGETPASNNTRPCLRWFADPSVPRPSLPAPAGRKALWFRFLAAPGLRGFEVAARGELQAWADGKPMTVESTGGHDGIRRHVATAARSCDAPVVMALRVAAPREFRAGDALPEPVKLHCGIGHLPAGDWCQHGLATYSGIAEYRRTIDWPALPRTARVILDAGEIRATAEILVNGQSAGTLVAPPWRLDLTPWLKEGKNELVIRVANTLANHYSVGIPSPYAFPEQTPSGLLGPVRLVIETTP